jgi:hypothetical protein
MPRIVPWKAAVLVGAISVLAGCSGGNPPTTGPTISSIVAASTSLSASPSSDESTTTVVVSPTTGQQIAITVEAIAAVICDTAPERMSSDAERFTKASYHCAHASEGVRIDLYESSEQQRKAIEVFSDFYLSLGDPRTLADLPVGCGAQWGFGADSNETRDTLISALSAADLPTALC